MHFNNCFVYILRDVGIEEDKPSFCFLWLFFDIAVSTWRQHLLVLLLISSLVLGQGWRYLYNNSIKKTSPHKSVWLRSVMLKHYLLVDLSGLLSTHCLLPAECWTKTGILWDARWLEAEGNTLTLTIIHPTLTKTNTLWKKHNLRSMWTRGGGRRSCMGWHRGGQGGIRGEHRHKTNYFAFQNRRWPQQPTSNGSNVSVLGNIKLKFYLWL